MIPNMPLTTGGQGDLQLRIVSKVQDPMTLFYESINEALKNGRMTEIIEAPVDLIQNLEFYIAEIELEQEKSSDMKKAMFVQSILNPMLQYFVPAGVADIGKLYLRYLESMGEHPADYSSSKVLPQLMSQWGVGYPQPNLIPQAQPVTAGSARGNPMGNMQQAQQGQMFGAQSNGGQGASAMSSPLINSMQNNQMPQPAQ
jgi:hypothetical protein